MEYEINLIKERCLECGDYIDYGRPDKKFCNDGCKNRYHNRYLREERRIRQRVINALNRNYDILLRLIRCDIMEISMMELRGMGFNFDYITSFQRMYRHEVFMCYDISFQLRGGLFTSITKLSLNLPPEIQLL